MVFCCIFTFFDCIQLKLYLLVLHVAQATLYDYRGLDGTGTASNPVSDKNSSDYVEYTVRKLADGNCWMAENLKLTLTNNQPVLVGTFSGGETSWTPTGDGAGNDYNEAINANTKSNISVNGKNEWYYPWYAATAGQGTQTSNPTISQSICPKGWKLPNHTSLQNLIINKYNLTSSATGSEKLQSIPLSFNSSGVYESGALSRTENGYYWTSSPYGTVNDAYILHILPSQIGISGSNNMKYVGQTVRCAAII